jgi:hypothetical protein
LRRAEVEVFEEADPMSHPSSDPPTADRLRDDIDSGLTGEKVRATDPAAAPLGTDAEAGGSPPTRAEREFEQRSRPTQPSQGSRGTRWIWAAGFVVLAMLVLALLGSG